MSTALKRRLLTEEEYLLVERQAEQRSEFVRGEMFAKSGATRNHNVIAQRISRLLGNQLEGRGCDVYQSDMKVRSASGKRFTYPDVVVVCGEQRFQRLAVGSVIQIARNHHKLCLQIVRIE